MNRQFFLLAILLTVSATFLTVSATTYEQQTHETVKYRKVGNKIIEEIQIKETLPDGVSSLQIYPTFWWVGMKYSKPELMIHFQDIGKAAAVTISYPGITLTDWHRVENPNYLFLHIRISPETKPGSFQIHVRPKSGGDPIDIRYTLLPRRSGNGSTFAQGVTSADFIYFLMPDRFSNGDPTNDRVPGMLDQSLNRDSIYSRHGGDLQGVIDHLDYLQQLGVTTLWMTPVIENDMPNRTEHGYAFTDHYAIEPRLGGAQLYMRLADSLHRRGMKLIQDAVYNHVGLHHFLISDLPDKNWLHQWPKYTQTNYRDQPLIDPHASAIDKKTSSDGWFTRQMPDLNQDNPDLAEFLIEHALWCVETFGVDGWRIDTYIYNSLSFMNRCNQALLNEYPRITMFGETWVHGTANQAWFVRNNLKLPFRSNLPGATDFQCLFSGIQGAIKDTSAGGGGVSELYNTLSDDFLYEDPMRNVIFLDNHDMTRFFSEIGEDVAGQKMGLEWLLTARGIPALYYGTEILMKGISNPDGLVRLDFPGGWKGDAKSAFSEAGLSADEQSVQQLVRTLGDFRRKSSALRTGRMMQYTPQKALYVYFRYDTKQTILCAMNTGESPVAMDFGRYGQRTDGFSIAVDVLTGRQYPLKEKTEIPGRTMWVLDLK